MDRHNPAEVASAQMHATIVREPDPLGSQH